MKSFTQGELLAIIKDLHQEMSEELDEDEEGHMFDNTILALCEKLGIKLSYYVDIDWDKTRYE